LLRLYRPLPVGQQPGSRSLRVTSIAFALKNPRRFAFRRLDVADCVSLLQELFGALAGLGPLIRRAAGTPGPDCASSAGTGRRYDRAGYSLGMGAPREIGRVIRTVVPSSSTLAMVSVPPWRMHNSRAMESPRPLP